MDIQINSSNKIKMDLITLQKMVLLYNSLEGGWTIKKDNDRYVFTKNHEGKKEIFLDTYLSRFLKDGFDINKII